MSEDMRFGIIGCGVIGKKHAQEITKIEGATLVAVADVIEVSAKELGEKYGATPYADFHEMLRRDDIDIVTVCTPSGMHAEMGIAAAKAGKHVIVEKPMDVSLAQADALIASCRDHGVKLCVISQHRFDRSTKIVKRRIEEGRFGAMILGEAAVNWHRSQGYYDSGAWRGTWALDGGGALMNQSIHTIDLLQYLMGPVESVFAHSGTLNHDRIEVEDVAVAVVQFKNGALGTIVGTTAAYPGLSARLEVFGTGGTAVIDEDRLTHLYLRAEHQADAAYRDKSAVNLAQRDDMGTEAASASGSADPAAISADAHHLQIVDMIESVRKDREPEVNGAEGRKPLEIILAIYRSARTGERVYLPL